RADGEASGEWQDWLVDETPDQEERIAESEEADNRRQLLKDAMGVLNDRERRIFEARRLAEDPITLEELSTEFGVSRERVRQIEVRAFEKVQKAVKKGARELERPRAEIEAAAAHKERRIEDCPRDEKEAKADDERPGAADGGNPIGHVLAERQPALEDLVDIARLKPARDPRNEAAIAIGEWGQPGMEKMLGKEA